MVRARAAVLREFGRPFEMDYINVAAGEDDVIVKVKSTGVCGRDIVVWRGGFRNLKLPLVLGHEVFGVTEDGEPVGVYPADPSSEEFLPIGERRQGGYAEVVAAPRSNIVRLPDEDFDKYAAATCGVATMIHASKVAGLKPGDRVFVTGASGGVGIHGIQYLSNVLQAKVIAYTRSREKAHVLESLGVNAVTDLSFYRSLGRVDYVFEIVGAPLINESMRSLRRGGTLVLVGNVNGEPIVIERPALIVMRELKISGTSAYTKSEYEEAVKLIAEGVVKPFYKAYRLSDVNVAYNDVLSGKVLGRAVLKP